MKDQNYEANYFWNQINKNNLQTELLQDLDKFKSSEINYKIAIWNPEVNGIRYLKTLIYNLCTTLTDENWRRISNIQNREIGKPISVRYNNTEICLDYLQAVLETEFIAKNIDIDNFSILEVGSGYGRTCHTIMSNHNIREYLIVDLDNCMTLSRNYLKSVLPKNLFSKIRFIPICDFKDLNHKKIDLSINIDSFAEMSAATVSAYLDFINNNSTYFYVKNPVGKYLDKTLDNHSQGNKVVELALKTGILLDIIDIFNNNEIKIQAHKFIDGYRPGNEWTCIDNAWGIPWSYYWQALYKH